MENLTVKGKITVIQDVVYGTSGNGKEWKKVVFVVSNNKGYEGREQIYAFEFFGVEKVDKFLKHNSVGKDVEVGFNIVTNEFKGRYYTSLSAWKCFGDKNTTESEKTEEIINNDVPF